MPTSTNLADALRAGTALPKRSVILLLGHTDTGKTTLAHDMIRYVAASNGSRVALIDADLGQTEIAIPGVVAAALTQPDVIESPARSWPICAAEFVGATSPPSHVTQWIGAVVSCARDALRAGADLCVIDTPGWVDGLQARTAYGALMTAIPPDLVLLMERPNAPNPLAGLFVGRSAPPVVAAIQSAPDVVRKERSSRTARRASRLGAYMADAASMTFDWEQIGILGAHFVGARSMPPHELTYIGRVLGSPCHYATRLPGYAMHIVVDIQCASGARNHGALTEHFGVRHVVVTARSAYEGLLCGLRDPAGRYLGAGLIERIDYCACRLTVMSPVKRGSPVAQVQFGVLRARPDGRELGTLSSGTF